MVQFLNWINFISKLVQYFLNWFIFFQTSLIFLNWFIFFQTSLIFFNWFIFFQTSLIFLNWFIFFQTSLIFLNWFIFLTSTLKKKRIILHTSLSPLSLLLLTLSFGVPTLPPLLILPEHFFPSKTNNSYQYRI